MDKAVVEQMSIPLASPSRPQMGRKRARHQESLAGDLGLDETVCHRVEQRLMQFPLVEETTCQEDSSSEEEYIPWKKRKTLKSGMDCIGTTLVKRSITCPHTIGAVLARWEAGCLW